MDAIAQQTLEALEGAEGEELSIVELVVAACEFSEDQGEIADLVDGLVETERVRLVRPDSGTRDALRAA